MALARKGTRLIVVGGRRYRYAVSARTPVVRIVAVADGRAGQRLVATLDGSDLLGWAIEHLVRPRLVEHVIVRGLDAGWNPAERGTVCQIALGDWKPFTEPTPPRIHGLHDVQSPRQLRP